MENLYNLIKACLGPLGRDVLIEKNGLLTNQGNLVIQNYDVSSNVVNVIKKSCENVVDGHT